MSAGSPSLETLVSFCKRKGFIYQTADIYGGLNGVYDVGPLGTLLKKNIRRAWLDNIDDPSYDILHFEGALLGPEAMWQASGHLEHFHDPLIECLKCQARFRADDIDQAKACKRCGAHKWGPVREFHMMFKTAVGAAAGNTTHAYLRPETAQSIFTNFKNIISSNRVKIPFGVAQIGKAFRNEITPRHFLFRMREFEQMEIEWFCNPADASYYMNFWQEKRAQFYSKIGIKNENIRFHTYEDDELAHYAHATVDIEYRFPFGWKELEGIAHRGDYDLKQHSAHSGKDLSVHDEAQKKSFIPYIIECSVGVDRLLLALLCDAYEEEKISEDDTRVVLRFNPHVAPITAAVLPLVKKLDEPAHALYAKLKKHGITVQYDVTGSIGKRYRRQDEIGTPICITYDYESETDQSVTIRHRDSMTQERLPINELATYLQSLTSSSSAE